MKYSKECLSKLTLENYLNEKKWYQEQVEKSRIEIEQGKVVSHNEAMDEVQKVIDDAISK